MGRPLTDDEHIPDNLTKANAERLANVIRRYWAGKLTTGLPTVRVEPSTAQSTCWVVRSDMLNAVPRASSLAARV